MTTTSLRRPRAGLAALALAGASLPWLAACGGGDNGVVADHSGTSSTVRMSCTGACVESDTLSPGQIEAHFYIVDDGSRAQAQAGFFNGFSIGYNVELEGDVVNFVQGSSSTRMALPQPGSDAFANLFDLTDSPYLADFALPSGAITGQFQMVRATQTLTSTVTLPAPFRITAPGNNATESKASDAVTIQLDAAQPDVAWDIRGASCVDTAGVTWSLSAASSGTYFSTADSRSFSFDAARYFASLKPVQSDGSVATLSSCAVTIHATLTNNGTVANGFRAGSSISAIQLRSLVLNLR